MSRRVLRVVAYGRPIPQGSKRHVGRGILVESSNVHPWRQTIEAAARDAMFAQGWERSTGPCSVLIETYFDRPKSHYGTGRNALLLRENAPRWPATRAQGDIEKLVRAAHDAFTSAGVWLDDSQVVALQAGRGWTHPHKPSLDRPGLVATVFELDS